MPIFRCESRQVILPSPELDDTHDIDGRIVLKKMNSGKVLSYVTDNVIATKSFKFVGVNRPKIEEFYLFLKASSGKEVEMEDFEANKWRGHILDNPETFTHVGRHNNQFTINFEGSIYA